MKDDSAPLQIQKGLLTFQKLRCLPKKESRIVLINLSGWNILPPRLFPLWEAENRENLNGRKSHFSQKKKKKKKKCHVCWILNQISFYRYINAQDKYNILLWRKLCDAYNLKINALKITSSIYNFVSAPRLFMGNDSQTLKAKKKMRHG